MYYINQIILHVTLIWHYTIVTVIKQYALSGNIYVRMVITL